MDTKAEEEFLATPIHDTGSMWYTVLSFFLPIVGLILGFIFRKKNHIRNYKKCIKGAVAGLIVIGVLIAILLIGLILVVI